MIFNFRQGLTGDFTAFSIILLYPFACVIVYSGTIVKWARGGNMKSIMMTYPGFQKLLKGLKRLLTTLENSLFGESAPALSLVWSRLPTRRENQIMPSTVNQQLGQRRSFRGNQSKP